MPAEYPKYFTTQVGLSPAEMKQFSEADVEALFEAFHALTLHDPLGHGVNVAMAWENYRSRRWADATPG